MDLPSEEAVNEAISFCEKFPEPYSAVLFGVLMVKQTGGAIAAPHQGSTTISDNDLPWADLSQQTADRVRALARSVEVPPAQLQKVYEFGDSTLTVVAPISALGPGKKEQMQNAALLYALARNKIHAKAVVPWAEVREACIHAGVDDPNRVFARCMKADDFPGDYDSGADGQLSVTGSVIAKGRDLLKSLLAGDA